MVAMQNRGARRACKFSILNSQFKILTSPAEGGEEEEKEEEELMEVEVEVEMEMEE